MHQPDGFSKKLQTVRDKYLGRFDTGLLCNCGKVNISDHATEECQHPIRDYSHEVRFGPNPTPHQRLQRFNVFHTYTCQGCGAVYDSFTIEKKRGYKPLEAREPIDKFLDKLSSSSSPLVAVYESHHR